VPGVRTVTSPIARNDLAAQVKILYEHGKTDPNAGVPVPVIAEAIGHESHNALRKRLDSLVEDGYLDHTTGVHIDGVNNSTRRSYLPVDDVQ